MSENNAQENKNIIEKCWLLKTFRHRKCVLHINLERKKGHGRSNQHSGYFKKYCHFLIHSLTEQVL
jgi:hypothetical protein